MFSHGDHPDGWLPFSFARSIEETRTGKYPHIPIDSCSVALLVVAGFAVTAFFAACGWFARRPSIVAFAVGMAVFALDTLIYINSGEWICVAFHAWALYALWRGVSATQQFKAIKQ